MAAWQLRSKQDIERMSPSSDDEISRETQMQYRLSYSKFLKESGMRLQVPQLTIATATVFTHIFFCHQSHAHHDHKIVAAACLFLAGKVEETPKPLQQVISVTYILKNRKDKFAAESIKKKEVLEAEKELVLIAERTILHTLNYNFEVEHPYKYMLTTIPKASPKVAANRELTQIAWNLVNDSYSTLLSLQFEPLKLAVVAITLAAELLKYKIGSTGENGEKPWWNSIKDFHLPKHEKDTIVKEILAQYETAGQSDRIASTSQADSIIKSGRGHASTSADTKAVLDGSKAEEQSAKASRPESTNSSTGLRKLTESDPKIGESRDGEQPTKSRTLNGVGKDGHRESRSSQGHKPLELSGEPHCRPSRPSENGTALPSTAEDGTSVKEECHQRFTERARDPASDKRGQDGSTLDQDSERIAVAAGISQKRSRSLESVEEGELPPPKAFRAEAIGTSTGSSL